ncbi:McrB family protein [Chryseobacterium sp. A321]
MRVEINHESEFEDYNGEVQLLSIDKIREVLTELFSQNPYRLLNLVNDGSLYSITYQNKITEEEFKINVFYGNIRNERRNEREKKIQLNRKDPRNLDNSIILGCYCYKNTDDLDSLIFVGWNIDNNTNYPSNPSLRGLSVDTLQKARFFGFYKHQFGANYICAFLPSFIFYYISNHENIHSISLPLDNILTLSSENIENRVPGFNKIYFGPPGTGKSHTIEEELENLNVKAYNYSRVTFHPDYDYHSFIGGYKPFTDKKDSDKIKYEFVPQVFTDLYVKAWRNTKEDYYLVIEEINRGNCAEIFGDIFQLLDRNPKYNIEPSTELRQFLEGLEHDLKEEIAEEADKVKFLFDGKLQMPNNLSILASMNTSDQSLYPMDSAFKRRWDWQYVPIDLKCAKSNFTIKVDDNKHYSWLEFLAKVNDRIYNVTKSEDKQIGNWFIDASKSGNIISKDLFINKVLFYLWNDIFKDEVFHPENIFIEKNSDGSKLKDISFNNFYNKEDQDRLLIHLLKDILNVPPLVIKEEKVNEYVQENNVSPEAAESKQKHTENNPESGEE